MNKTGTRTNLSTSRTAIAEEGPRTLRESFLLVRSSPYLVTIAALIWISSIVTGLASWQFGYCQGISYK